MSNKKKSETSKATDETPLQNEKEIAKKIVEIAKLRPIEYELKRETFAKECGLRVSALDRCVDVERKNFIKQSDTSGANPFTAVESWPEPVDGAALLSEIHRTIRRFCVLPDHSAPLMAAWVLHAWTHDAAEISPFLAFVSPEKRCGKTTALSVLGALVPKPMHNVNMTSAVLFRVISLYKPTVLIDEADTYLVESHELRGILNGGHRRMDAYVWRSVGEDYEPHQFRVWAPKCIAMIGRLPDTLEDRALVVPLRRKYPEEKVERFNHRGAQGLYPLKRKCARWAEDNLEQLTAYDPEVPDALNDRAQDNARAICAIADLAGGNWPELVRKALIGTSISSRDEPQSHGVRLLHDIAEIARRCGDSRMSSEKLAAELRALEGSDWAEWGRGAPISANGVARLLKAFRIRPRRDRNGSYYAFSDFDDAFKRYLTPSP